MTPQEALRSLADNLDYIEERYKIKCIVIRGQGCWGSEDCDFRHVDLDRFWDAMTEDDYGFIGIMPNQWRPEVHLHVMIKGVNVRLYSFVSEGFHQYDGGFLNEYPKMMKKLKNAPEFIKTKLRDLHAECVKESEKKSLEQELLSLEEQRNEVKEKLKPYTEPTP